MNLCTDKTIKINKKVKLKSLKQVINLCVKNKISLSMGCDGEVIISDGYDDMELYTKDFDKSHTIIEASIEFDNNEDNGRATFFETSMGILIPVELSALFTNFPKLTKKQLAPEPIPPEIKVTDILTAGKGHDSHSMQFRENGTLTVGCHDFSKQQVENIFKFLGGCLNYDLED